MRMTFAVIAFLVMAGVAGAEQPLLSSHQALAKAIDILKGDPYGATAADVARNIKHQALEVQGSDKPCGVDFKTKPAWRFQVFVPKSKDKNEIRGDLLIDAHTGQMLCAGLPFLD